MYRQADHIERIVDGYRSALAVVPIGYEILLVANGPDEATAAVCRRLAEAHADVRVHEIAEPGWGRAVRAGVREARGDVLCYTNSARTTPEILTVLLVYAAAYPGVVLKANRRIRDSIFRRLGSLLYNLECRALFDLAEWDINGTPKVFPRTFDKLLALERNDDLIDLEFLVVCSRENYPVIEVPLLATVRHGGRSTTNVRSALRMYRGAYALRRAAAHDAR